jgi:predicted nucleic acid-binding protein
MTFVDSNVFMYAVGQWHPLKMEAREFLAEAHQKGNPLCTSAEVLQELVHVYKSTGRVYRFEDAFSLITRYGIEVWPLEADDVTLARQLHERHPTLSARLCHLASCRRRGVREIKTYDQAFRAVVE